MPDTRGQEHEAGAAVAELPFRTLWYRFLFFDWMFQDVQSARNVYERHAARRHNRHMRRYLPIYLRRWMTLSATGFMLGWLCERAAQPVLLTAWGFTWSCLAFTAMIVIAVAWACLARID